MHRFFAVAVVLALLAGAAQAGTLRDDGQQLVSYQNLNYAGVGLGLAGVARLLDYKIDTSVERSGFVEQTSDLTNIYGDSRFNLPVSLGLWLGGKAVGRPGVEALGSGLLRALLLTQAVVGPIKLGVGRERPNGTDSRSFPSGHTANSFAIGRVLHRQYGLPAGLPMYVIGGLVGAGRIEDRHHYLSDVVMGAVLGAIVGNSITLDQKGRFALEPVGLDNGVVLAMAIHW